MLSNGGDVFFLRHTAPSRRRSHFSVIGYVMQLTAIITTRLLAWTKPGRPTRLIITLALLLTCAFGSSHSKAQQGVSPAQAPVLRINAPFAAPLWRVDVDRDETTFVSSSAYKSATLWSADDLSAPRHARVPLRDEQRRRAHGVAVTPDGDSVAYSVPPLAQSNGTPIPGTARIYILRTSDGKIEQVIDKEIATRPQALKFSGDGRHLAAVLSNGCGLRVWETTGWTLITQDDDGYAGNAPATCCRTGDAAACAGLPDTTGVAFGGASDAPILVTSGDTGLRRYVFDGLRYRRQLAVTPASIGLERPEGMALSPDGKALAIADRRERGAERSEKAIVLRIALVAIDTLQPLRAPFELSTNSPALEFSAYLDPIQVPDARLFSLHRVAWLADGSNQWIYAGGFFACEAGKRTLVQPAAASRADVCLVRWSATRPTEQPRFIPIGTDRVMDILPLSKSGRVMVATQRSISLLNPDGTVAARPDGTPFAVENRAADFRGVSRAFSISADAKKVYFEDYLSRADAPVGLMFDAEALAITENAGPGEATVMPNQDANIISDPAAPRDPRRARWWINTEGPPRFLGQPLVDRRIDRDDIYRSVALHLETRTAVVGSANFLRVVGFGDGPPKIRCELATSEEVYRVNITPDGGIIVAGHSDGVLRWYRHTPAPGDTCQIELVLSAYLARSAEGQWTWIAWVPTGEFANHPAALGLVSWQVTDANGAIKSVDFGRLLAWYKQDVVKGSIASARSRSAVVASAE